MRKLANVGLDNYISGSKVLSISAPPSAPIKKLVKEAKERNMCLDFTCGKKTESVIFLISGHIGLSIFQPKTLAKRFDGLISKEDDVSYPTIEE